MQNSVIIKKLKITGFKSIENIELEDVPFFMVLAGANGSGKSNFVDALYFLSLVLKDGVEKSIEHFGLDKVFFEDDDSYLDKVSYHIEIFLFGKLYQYHTEIDITKKEIISENLVIKEKDNIFDYQDLLEKAKNEISKIETNNSKDNNQNEINPLVILLGAILGGALTDDMRGVIAGGAIGALLSGYNPNSSKLNQENPKNISLLNKILGNQNPFLESINNIAIYRIDTNIAKYSPSQYSSELSMNGDNLISVLAELENNDELRETILDWLSLIVPEMQHIKTDNRPIDGSKMLEFTEESGKKFPAHLVSDGTIYALCMLVAILTRTKKAGITIIEEPERGLHPKAIGELIGFMREYASISHPIILTTHSESVVRELELNELFFVSKENGKTKIKSIKDSGVDKKEIPLDTAWLTNMFNGGLPW